MPASPCHDCARPRQGRARVKQCVASQKSHLASQRIGLDYKGIAPENDDTDDPSASIGKAPKGTRAFTDKRHCPLIALYCLVGRLNFHEKGLFAIFVIRYISGCSSLATILDVILFLL